MSELLDQLLAERHHTVVLRSGRKVGYHLPDVQECILRAGQVPLETLTAKLDTEITDEEAEEVVAASPDVLWKGLRYSRAIVAAMLDDIDGTPVLDEERDQLAAALEPEEREHLYRIGTRQEVPETGEA